MRPVDPARLGHAIEVYRSGKTIEQTAAEVGIDPSVVSAALHASGVELHPRGPSPFRISLPADTLQRYRAGESVLSIARRLGVSRPVITRYLLREGAEIRGPSDSMRVRAAQMTAGERSALAAAAHAAIRGKRRSDASLAGRALARQHQPPPPSPGEAALAAWLSERGLQVTPELAVGKYNLDLAIAGSRIGVEVLGGHWHHDSARHCHRIPYLLGAGWHLLYVWNTRRQPLAPAAADYIHSFAEQSCRDPAAIRQYRVIRGDGELVAAGRAGDDDFPVTDAPEAGLR